MLRPLVQQQLPPPTILSLTHPSTDQLADDSALSFVFIETYCFGCLSRASYTNSTTLRIKDLSML